MTIWAMGDLHLSFGIPNKGMEFFGPSWENWTHKIEDNWKNSITADDLVLLPGDISWAMHVEDAVPDLQWIDQLPGTKVMVRGNHDFWWNSLKKIEKVLPPSIHLIQNNAFNWKNCSIAGARLWDTNEYQFGPYIDYKENKRENKLLAVDADGEEAERIFVRDLARLELSLKALSPQADFRVVMTHYPPIGADLADSRASLLLEKYQVNACVFGHLHNVKENSLPFGEKNKIKYFLTSADYLNFKPLKIIDN